MTDIRRSPIAICGLLWTPFDVRFRDLLERMQFRKEIIGDELKIVQAQASNRAEEAAAQERILADRERQSADKSRIEIERISGLTEQMKESLENHAKCT